jgi:hypothetical protein
VRLNWLRRNSRRFFKRKLRVECLQLKIVQYTELLLMLNEIANYVMALKEFAELQNDRILLCRQIYIE